MLLIRHAEVDGEDGVDVRCSNGEVTQIAARLTGNPGETVIDAEGGALLPGLHDHHIHLFSLAAARQSVLCGPPAVTDMGTLGKILGQQGGDGWISRICWLILKVGTPGKMKPQADRCGNPIAR